MSSGKVVAFDELSSADLVVDAVYQSGRKGNHSDDPISHIVKVSNQGGFRYRGSLDSLGSVPNYLAVIPSRSVIRRGGDFGAQGTLLAFQQTVGTNSAASANEPAGSGAR